MSMEPVLASADLTPGTAVRVVVADREVCVVRTEDGSVHAVDDICTPAYADACEAAGIG